VTENDHAADPHLCPKCRRGDLRLLRAIRRPYAERETRYFHCDFCAHVQIDDA
jgi:hypothetical protein